MKQFEVPAIEVVYFSIDDVITTSGDPNETPKG